MWETAVRCHHSRTFHLASCSRLPSSHHHRRVGAQLPRDPVMQVGGKHRQAAVVSYLHLACCLPRAHHAPLPLRLRLRLRVLRLLRLLCWRSPSPSRRCQISMTTHLNEVGGSGPPSSDMTVGDSERMWASIVSARGLAGTRKAATSSGNETKKETSRLYTHHSLKSLNPTSSYPPQHPSKAHTAHANPRRQRAVLCHLEPHAKAPPRSG